MLLCLVGTPSGVAKENTNDTIIVTAMATDQDTNDTLIYTLWYGISADSITTKGVSSDTTRSGTSVTLTQTGLNNNTTYYFTVTVTDSKDTVSSNVNSQKTLCRGDACSGGGYNNEPCTDCSETGKVTCSSCNGGGTIVCPNTCTNRKCNMFKL